MRPGSVILGALVLASAAANAHPGASGAGRTCDTYNPALYKTGNTYQVVSRLTEDRGHSFTVKIASKVMGQATFHGHDAIDIRRHIVDSAASSAAISSSGDYFYGIGETVIYIYGYRTHEGGKEYEEYDDPPASFPKRYVINVPYTATDTEHFSGHDNSHTLVVQVKSMFLGKQSITVPAGTFVACRMSVQASHLSNGPEPGIVYSWTVASGALAGLDIKMTNAKPATDPSAYTRVALSVRWNGK